MHELLGWVWRRVAACFLAGLLAMLPIVITVAIVVWMVGFLERYLGPDTVVGGYLTGLGLSVRPDSTIAYLLGWIVVLGVVMGIGVLVELGAKSLISRLADRLFRQIPLIGSIYSTSKQVVEMLDKKQDDALQGMTAVYCAFGNESPTLILALLVSPERYQFQGKEYYIVVIPTAPVPFGGAMLFVPADSVRPADMPVEGLMSMYISMGLSAPEYLATSRASSSQRPAPPPGEQAQP